MEYLSNRSTWIYIVALILLVTLFSFKVYAMPEGLVFTDIKGHENENIIKKWSDFNIISGYDNNTFMPDRYITRAEFSVIIDNILKSTNFNNYIYLDAFPGEWHYIPLSKAVSKGILKPYENRIFPMEYITKKEALDAIKAAFGISSSNEPLAINESITRSGLLKELDNLIGKIYSSPGSYSFDFPLEGSIIVNSPNVSLNNVHINGNLIITESASALSISNVSANGKIIILGKTNTELSSPEPLNINFTGPDGNIYVYGNYADISLSGNLNTLVLNTPNSRINLLSGKINSINLNGNSNINISGSASINKISSSSPHSIILNNTENISEISENIKISGTNSNKAKEEPNKPSIISSSDSEDYNEDIPSPSNENNQNPPHKAEKFNIIFNANGGKFKNNASKLEFQLEIDSKLYFSMVGERPTKNGFSFKGWALEKDSSEGIDDGFPISSDITLFAVWEKMPDPVFTVSFDANGGVFEDDLEILDFQLNKNSPLYFSIADQNPTKGGFSFKGWAFERDSSEGIDDGFPISSDITLFAVWEKMPEPVFTVSFDANGGVFKDDLEILDFQLNKDSVLYFSIIDKNPMKDSFFFKGWAFERDSSDDIDDGFPISSDITLFAIWEKIPEPVFTVSFNANGGVFEDDLEILDFQINKDSVLYFSIIDKNPMKDGFSFIGWAFERDSSDDIDDGFPISSDITLFAIWEKMPEPIFTVSFNANGGVFEDDLEILDFQLNKNSVLYFSIIDKNPAKDGFSFIGWAFERDSSEDIDDGFPVSSDITLFAIWEKMPEPVFTVSFDANGGVFEDDLEILDFQLNKDSVLYFSIIDKRPTKDGFSFKGWAFEKDASEGIVDGFSISSDITFFAIWEKNNIEDGSYATPFIINSPYDFLSIGSDTGEHEGWKMNSCYKINFDIDMAGINFSPIGSKDKKFTGVLMGNGKNIINIRLNSNELYQGLFSYLGNSGVIENLNISFDEIKIASNGSGNVFFGGIAGYNEGNIKNCRVEISDFNSEITYNSKTAFYAGGVAGNNAGNIEHASAYFNITSASGNSYIGGISGYSSGNIGASSSEFNIEITKKGGTAYTGGIAGNNESIISNSYSQGTLSISGVGVDNFAGLLAGNNNGTIKNAYTEGNIISQIIRTRSCLGAIAGYNNGNIENCVTIAEKISSVFIDKLHIKRISGYNAASKGLLNNYALNTMILEVEGEAVDITSNKNEEHGESTSIESIEDKSFFNTIGWDFDIWTWDSEIKRPVITVN